jgi:hypothetical protein
LVSAYTLRSKKTFTWAICPFVFENPNVHPVDIKLAGCAQLAVTQKNLLVAAPSRVVARAYASGSANGGGLFRSNPGCCELPERPWAKTSPKKPAVIVTIAILIMYFMVQASSKSWIREKTMLRRKTDLQIGGAGRESRNSPTRVVGKKPYGKSQFDVA